MLSETRLVVNKYSCLFEMGVGYRGLGFRCRMSGVRLRKTEDRKQKSDRVIHVLVIGNFLLLSEFCLLMPVIWSLQWSRPAFEHFYEGFDAGSQLAFGKIAGVHTIHF